MIKNSKEGPEEFKNYDSELLLKILNKTSRENKKGDDKELFVDENWKINSKIAKEWYLKRLINHLHHLITC